MKTLNQLRAERAALVKKTREFLETRAKDDARLSAEDDAMYSRMEDDLLNYDRQIERMERLDQRESQMAMPTSAPIVSKPAAAEKPVKIGRGADD